MDIVFAQTRAGQSTTYKLVLVGPMTVAKTVRISSQPLTLGVRFRPGGATSVLGIQARETQDCVIPLADIAKSRTSELVDQLATVADVRSQLSLLESFSDPRVRIRYSMDPAFAAILQLLADRRPSVHVKAIAAGGDFGMRRLSRAFDKWVGLHPSMFCRVMRFRRLVAAVNRSHGGTWLDRALEAGYYDQAHMNRDFKDFVGLASSDFIAMAN